MLSEEYSSTAKKRLKRIALAVLPNAAPGLAAQPWVAARNAPTRPFTENLPLRTDH
jgi:hypothetical protein